MIDNSSFYCRGNNGASTWKHSLCTIWHTFVKLHMSYFGDQRIIEDRIKRMQTKALLSYTMKCFAGIWWAGYWVERSKWLSTDEQNMVIVWLMSWKQYTDSLLKFNRHQYESYGWILYRSVFLFIYLYSRILTELNWTEQNLISCAYGKTDVILSMPSTVSWIYYNPTINLVGYIFTGQQNNFI